MTDELISRKALLAEMWRSGKAAYLVVQDAPAVDAVEVVRCKECKHRADEVERKGIYLCNLKMIGLVRANDFCSFGERREDDGTAQI